ncbi:MAG TPA: hypothetical protein VK054_08860, partial [Beutenbergiaceae bacterium]|nr:hypothetical protein [Beutenbergiaceae bacterium]
MREAPSYATRYAGAEAMYPRFTPALKDGAPSLTQEVAAQREVTYHGYKPAYTSVEVSAMAVDVRQELNKLRLLRYR